jgi:hypothetical protein
LSDLRRGLGRKNVGTSVMLPKIMENSPALFDLVGSSICEFEGHFTNHSLKTSCEGRKRPLSFPPES